MGDDHRVEAALIALDSQVGRGEGKIDGQNDTFGYYPWSQIAYVARARSFSWQWAERPAPANVIFCARYGWRQATPKDPMSLVCTVCNERIYLPWDEELVVEAQRIVAEEYFKIISDKGHGLGGSCPWRSNPCNESITTVRFISLKREQDLVQERLYTFKEVKSTRVFMGEEEAFEKLLLVARTFFGKDDDYPIGILLLALMQWQLHGKSVNCSLGCCELPLEEVLNNPDGFDTIASHSYFCPFVYGPEPAWKALIDLWLTKKSPYSNVMGGEAKGAIPSLDPLLSNFTCNAIYQVLGDDLYSSK